MSAGGKLVLVGAPRVITDRDPGDEHVPRRLDVRQSADVIPIGIANGSRTWIAAQLRVIADEFETGAASGVAFVVLRGDGDIGTFVDFVNGHEQPFYLLGALESLKRRVMASIEEG